MLDAMSHPNHVQTTYRFKPVGECIYCGARAGLSDEHIVPYALGGTFFLPLASCQK